MTDIIVGKKISGKSGEVIPFDAYTGNNISNINDPIGTIYYSGSSDDEAAIVERFAYVRNTKFEYVKNGSTSTTSTPVSIPTPESTPSV